MELLQRILSDCLFYAKVYKHAHQILQEAGDHGLRVQLHFDSDQHDQRGYNLPTADEIAVITPNDSQHFASFHDIVLHRCGGIQDLVRLSDSHPAYSCLHYMLLFPCGEHGWCYDLKQVEPEIGVLCRTGKRSSLGSGPLRGWGK